VNAGEDDRPLEQVSEGLSRFFGISPQHSAEICESGSRLLFQAARLHRDHLGRFPGQLDACLDIAELVLLALEELDNASEIGCRRQGLGEV
jgi:hypothetical protein